MSNGGDKKSLAAKVAQQNSEKDWQDTGSPSQILEDEYDMHTYNNGYAYNKILFVFRLYI